MLPTGVFAASLTAFDADGRVDVARTLALARWLLAHGCDGLAPLGTTGEANALSVPERLELIAALVDGGLPLERLLVGTGCCALPDTVALTREAVASGVGGVLVLPPFYYKEVSEDGLFAYFAALIEQVGDARLRLYLYHFPRMTGVPFSLPLVERLHTAWPEVVVGMKDSGGDLAHMQAVCTALPGFRLYAGTERLLLPVLRAGGVGCISATTNVSCHLAAQVFSAWKTGADAEALQARLADLRQTIEAWPMIPALKRLLATTRADAAWRHLRPPLMPLDPTSAARLEAALESFQALLSPLNA
jgi:4-hydroxy-tetrahydrodipicolinate synthase